VPAFAEELLTRFRWIGGHADVLGLLHDAGFLARSVEALAEPFEKEDVTKVAGVEARGFVFGAAVATRLGAGFVPVRKPGSIHPGPKAVHVSTPDGRGRSLAYELQRAALGAGDLVLLVDDWAETGSQALAARALIEECGGVWSDVGGRLAARRPASGRCARPARARPGGRPVRAAAAEPGLGDPVAVKG
jgi:adenine phosphoribosyltransferase